MQTVWMLFLVWACHGQDFEPVRAAIRQRLKEEAIPSLAVAAARGKQILWEEGFGWADRERRVRATEHTLYSLASVSKPITATGLMVLVEQGRIQLDEPVNAYLRHAPLRAKVGEVHQATVRRLANHTAGLPLHYHFFPEDEPFTRPPMEETIRRYGILVTPPGERYQYSNIGYGILEYLIATQSGLPYEEFMHRAVFAPLGLHRTAVGVPAQLAREQAVRYGIDQRPLPFYDFDHRGASAVFSSAHDLIRFAMFHLKTPPADQKPILSVGAIEEMQRPSVATGPSSGYGIGWAVSTRGGRKLVSHTGGMSGVSTILLLSPAEKTAVVALCNARSSLPAEIAYQILEVLSGRPVERYSSRAAESRDFRPGPEFTGTWKGRLETHAGSRAVEMRIFDSGDVHIRLEGQLWTLLNGPRVDGGYLTGVMMGDIGTPDASRRRHTIQLSLKLRGDVLNGAATAISLPQERLPNALTSWLELKKQ